MQKGVPFSKDLVKASARMRSHPLPHPALSKPKTEAHTCQDRSWGMMMVTILLLSPTPP